MRRHQFFIGAIITHLRVRFYSIGSPVSFLLLAVAAQVLALTASRDNRGPESLAARTSVREHAMVMDTALSPGGSTLNVMHACPVPAVGSDVPDERAARHRRERTMAR